MSSTNIVDLCSDDEIGDSVGKNGGKRPHSALGILEVEGNAKVQKVHRKSKRCSAGQEFEDKRSSSNIFSISQSGSSGLDQGCSPDDESSPSQPSQYPAPICRQFWKAGNYDPEQSAKIPIHTGKNHLHVHPAFLHSNATSHKWTFGAIAELLDNAVDEIQKGATFAVIDKTTNPRDGSTALLIQDDGGGMDPEAIRRCMSFGFSEKQKKSTIGQYGNGFKTSSMRLGADAIVLTRHSRERILTQSVGLLSYTFLTQTGHDRIVVPLVDYEFNASTGKLGPMLPHGKEQFSSNLTVLLQWSPYSTERMLLKQFDDIGHHGTKIVVYNLWLNDDGDMELDFNSDAKDIRINADVKLFQTGHNPKPISDQHIANLYRYSLRAYASILYLRLPQSFKIILRGLVVEHHNIAGDLKFPEFILYKPHFGGTVEAAVVTTIGFLKDAPHVNIHGFNIYHRNRLILPFWRVVKNVTNSSARGVVGVLEANFIEPTHDKQDFEKTSLFQKLEARLKEMTMEYWRFHCGLIGYQVKKPPPALTPSREPLFSRVQNCVRPVTLNPNSSTIDSSRLVSSSVGSFEDAATTSQHISGKSLRRYSDNHHVRSLQGLKIKRKEQNATVELEPKKHTGLGSFGTDTQLNGVKQPSSHNERQLHDEKTILMQENRKLRSQLLELERREPDFNRKVQQLRIELGEVHHEYGRLLAELESMAMIEEKIT